MDRLRVLLLTETFHPEIGGGERQAHLLSRALVRRGHEVTIITRRSRPELPSERLDDGVRVIRIGPTGRGRWKKWGLAVSAIEPLVRLRSRADVVFVSGYRIMGMPAVLITKMLGRTCVLKADSSGEMSGEFFRAGLSRFHLAPASSAVRLFVGSRNALLRRADAFIAISSEIARELRAHGVPAERIHQLPNAVDMGHCRPANFAERAALRRRLGLPDGPVVIYTGRLVSYKGLPLLLRVWCELHRSGTPGTLVLVGSGGTDMHNCENDLREYVAHERLDDSVVFAGEVDNVDDYLRASDAFVFPTENEAFGVSLVEAMACGLPSVATPVGGIPDFLVDGRNGLLAEPGNFAQLRDRIAVLAAGGDAVSALGRAARETVVSRFSIDAVVERYLGVFESLLDRGAVKKAS